MPESPPKFMAAADALGLEIHDSRELLRLVRQGLPFACLDRLAQVLALELGGLAELLQISTRTLARRRQSGQLSSVESDRAARVARLWSHALRVFGGQERALAWLKRENMALGGVVPLSLLDTDLGVSQVDDSLTRIEHGVFA